MSKAKVKVTVARYIEEQLAICGKPQTEVARDCGYENPNVISLWESEGIDVVVVPGWDDEPSRP